MNQENNTQDSLLSKESIEKQIELRDKVASFFQKNYFTCERFSKKANISIDRASNILFTLRSVGFLTFKTGVGNTIKWKISTRGESLYDIEAMIDNLQSNLTTLLARKDLIESIKQKELLIFAQKDTQDESNRTNPTKAKRKG